MLVNGLVRGEVVKGSAFTLQELAKEADVALQTFYRYFSSKDQLLLALIEVMVTEACQEFEERSRTLVDPIARLRFYITTTLDPHLLVAYRFGAMFLSQAPPSGAGRPDLAVELIERGIQANPEYWRLYEDLGFVYYFDLKDYQKASEAFLEGSKKPNAQIWMKVMAARIAAEGESFSTSVFLWKDIYESALDPSVRNNARIHLQLLKVKEDCRQIDVLADEYEKRNGRRPIRMAELVQAGLLRGLPKDPEGFAYVFGDNGKAELNLESPLLEQQLLFERYK